MIMLIADCNVRLCRNIVMVYKDVGFVENHINKDLEAGQV
jgi:hypothetical protein